MGAIGVDCTHNSQPTFKLRGGGGRIFRSISSLARHPAPGAAAELLSAAWRGAVRERSGRHCQRGRSPDGPCADVSERSSGQAVAGNPQRIVSRQRLSAGCREAWQVRKAVAVGVGCQGQAARSAATRAAASTGSAGRIVADGRRSGSPKTSGAALLGRPLWRRRGRSVFVAAFDLAIRRPQKILEHADGRHPGQRRRLGLTAFDRLRLELGRRQSGQGQAGQDRQQRPTEVAKRSVTLKTTLSDTSQATTAKHDSKNVSLAQTTRRTTGRFQAAGGSPAEGRPQTDRSETCGQADSASRAGPAENRVDAVSL